MMCCVVLYRAVSFDVFTNFGNTITPSTIPGTDTPGICCTHISITPTAHPAELSLTMPKPQRSAVPCGTMPFQ